MTFDNSFQGGKIGQKHNYLKWVPEFRSSTRNATVTYFVSRRDTYQQVNNNYTPIDVVSVVFFSGLFHVKDQLRDLVKFP